MSPATIAHRAWVARHDRPPLDTIYDALGLDRHPRVHRDGTGPVNRLSACLDAWWALVQEKGEHVRTDRRPAVTMVCEHCGEAFGCEARLVDQRRYCGRSCAVTAREAERREALTARNLEIVRRANRGERPESIALDVGLSTGRVRDLIGEHRRGDGWTEYMDGEAA